MTEAAYQRKPRPSQIVAKMVAGRRYTPTQLAFALDCDLPAMQKLLKAMQADLTITCIRPRSGERIYHLPEEVYVPGDVAGPRVAPDPTPLSPEYSMEWRRFQEGCMGVRR